MSWKMSAEPKLVTDRYLHLLVARASVCSDLSRAAELWGGGGVVSLSLSLLSSSFSVVAQVAQGFSVREALPPRI